jgi:hypothetical protein
MTRDNDAFSYEITQHLATLSQRGNVTKELNLISFNGSAPKYDLRAWRRIDGKESFLKGITLSSEEMDALKQALAQL